MADDNGDKTEEATPHQLEKAREEGNVAKSKELTAGFLLMASFVFLYLYMPFIIDIFKSLFTQYLNFKNPEVSIESTKAVMFTLLLSMAKILLPFLILLYVASFATEAAQVGLQISSKALGPKWERINFFANLPKFFSIKQKVVELIKATLKIIILGYIGISIIISYLSRILHTPDIFYTSSQLLLGKLIFEIVIKITLAVIILGLVDLIYQKQKRKNELRMTKQQLKEEYKQMEGDPLIKQRIKEAQREMSRARMMQEVPKADVVIANPIHYAVALKYDGKKPPVVVAKGQRLMALKIKEIAKENGVFIKEDPPLARTLYKTLEIDDEIPENLFKAVAEILAEVYKSRASYTKK